MSNGSNPGTNTLSGRFVSSSSGHVSEPSPLSGLSTSSAPEGGPPPIIAPISPTLPLTSGAFGDSPAEGTQAQSPGLLFQHELVLRCEEVIKKFKEGTVTQTRAISLLAGILSESDHSSQSDTALESFMAQLESHTASLGRAAVRGGTSLPSRRQDSPVNDAPDEPDPSDDGHGPSSKRSHNSSDDDSEPEESDGEDGSHHRSSKKRLVFEHELPWFADDLIAQALLHPELLKTQKTLAYFARDFSAIKRFIASSITIPEFPDSEWDNVIRGRPINLDSVFSSVNAVSPVYEHSERLGAYEIKFGGGGSRLSAKKIQTHGEWLMAWTLTTRAICHAFPHRARELQDYGNFITRQFGAIISSEAMRVISFDESVRTFVGSRNDILLTDFHRFDHLKTTFLSSFGAQSFHQNSNPKTPGSKRTPIEKSPDTCNKYNSQGGCGFSSGRCKYQHRCRKCHRSGHPIADCTQPAN